MFILHCSLSSSVARRDTCKRPTLARWPFDLFGGKQTWIRESRGTADAYQCASRLHLIGPACRHDIHLRGCNAVTLSVPLFDCRGPPGITLSLGGRVRSIKYAPIISPLFYRVNDNRSSENPMKQGLSSPVPVIHSVKSLKSNQFGKTEGIWSVSNRSHCKAQSFTLGFARRAEHGFGSRVENGLPQTAPLSVKVQYRLIDRASHDQIIEYDGLV